MLQRQLVVGGGSVSIGSTKASVGLPNAISVANTIDLGTGNTKARVGYAKVSIGKTELSIGKHKHVLAMLIVPKTHTHTHNFIH